MGAEKMPPKTEVEPSSQDYQEHTRKLADEAREERDALNPNRRGFETAQKAFEKAERIHDRSRGVVEESLYSHDHVRSREANERTDEIKAQEQNSRRTILDRLMGRNKMSSYDVMRDEADRMNDLVDKRTEHDDGLSPQIASDEIAESEEFAPNTRSEFWDTGETKAVAELVARMRKVDPRIESELNTGHAQSFLEFVSEEEQNARTQEESRMISNASSLLLKQKLDTFIRTRDVYAAEALISNRDANIPLSQEFLEEIPDEFLQYKEIRDAIINRIAHWRTPEGKGIRDRIEKFESNLG